MADELKGEEAVAVEPKPRSSVRENLLKRRGYTPYCGAGVCGLLWYEAAQAGLKGAGAPYDG